MCTETKPSNIQLEHQHPELPEAHDTGVSTWRGRDYITYPQPHTCHLSPKDISIPSSFLAHYSKHCLVPAQHIPVTLVPARKPCPPPTTPSHGTAVDLWEAVSLTAANSTPQPPGPPPRPSATDKSTEAREEVVIPGSRAHQVQLPYPLVFTLVCHVPLPPQPSSWKAGALSSLQVTFNCI